MDALTPYVIRYAYERGAFPMAEGRHGRVQWYTSPERCLIPIEGIHVSRSLRRKLNQMSGPDPQFRVTFDQAFTEVMRACQRPGEDWISDEMIAVYTVIHQQGWAHSCEVWQDENLVGGVYGVAIGGCFCGESKFHRVTDASKIALYFLVERLRELGFEMFDAQFINDHTRSLGAFEITHHEYLRRLKALLQVQTAWS